MAFLAFKDSDVTAVKNQINDIAIDGFSASLKLSNESLKTEMQLKIPTKSEFQNTEKSLQLRFLQFWPV